MRKLKELFLKHLYISMLIFELPIYILDKKMDVFSAFLSKTSASDNLSALASLSGTFIGFLLAILTIFIGLNLDPCFMKIIISHKHHLIFLKCVIGGILAYLATIVLWIFGTDTLHCALYFFFAGCLETLATLYYMIVLFKARFTYF